MTSVGPSVTLVDCDNIMHQKVEIGTTGYTGCLGYLHAEANLDYSILRSQILLRNTTVKDKPDFCLISSFLFWSYLMKENSEDHSKFLSVTQRQTNSAEGYFSFCMNYIYITLYDF